MRYASLVQTARRAAPSLLRTAAPTLARPSIVVARKTSASQCLPSWQIQRCFISSTARLSAEVSEEDPDSLAETANPREKTEITSKYASLKPYLDYDIWKALTGKPFGFEDMSIVQQRVLGLLPDLADPMQADMPDGQGRDMLVKAKTGTGKTVAFLVPALERRVRAIKNLNKGILTEPFRKMIAERAPNMDLSTLDKHAKGRLMRQFGYNTSGILVISPTRELATQIATEAEKLCTYHKDLEVQLLVGGTSRVQQLRKFGKGRADIVIATPGRLIDLLESESVVRGPLSALQTLIYDEADTLLDMGFRDEMEKIVSYLPKAQERTTMLFSATVSSDVREIARKSLLPDHRFIDCVPKGEDNLHMNVPQNYTVIKNAEEQFAHLARLIALDQVKNAGKSKVIVFCPTRSVTSLFAKRFASNRFRQGNESLAANLPAGERTRIYELHSQIDSRKRFQISDTFRQDKSGASVLFTSDVSARGVDYPGTTHVVQIGIPSSPDIYVHRVGRTGRAGASGRADLILQPFEEKYVRLELGKLPLKNVDTASIQGELTELASKFDEDPRNVISEDIYSKMHKSERRTSRDAPMGLTGLRGPLMDKVGDGILERVAAAVASASDKEVVEECFLSMLGYYASRSRELQSPIPTICEDLKEWAVSAGDLDRPPYVSDSFLAKLGTGYRERAPRLASNARGDGRDRFSNSRGRGSGRGSSDGGRNRSRKTFDDSPSHRSNSRSRDERFF